MLRIYGTKTLSILSSRSLAASSRASLFSSKPKEEVDDDETFELLPPGCSMVDPTYGLKDSETTVLFYDESLADDSPSKPKKVKGKSMPSTPANLATAQKQLQDKKDAEEDEPYVYLPPGSSMRDPGYNSMSDPLEKRVNYIDPTPDTKKP
ncbi:hypothetical protein Ndes2526B_g00280 [Nannochloris sp. 'desiccata']|nr:hypothetical protein KSW81_003083 [Chlorella desiccata (nom. nud.)]KAH7624910.1 hypothetical protein NADE_002130 [Chlorella desiccata (nom. nud.)]